MPCACAASVAPVAARRPSQVPVGVALGDNAERGGTAVWASEQRESYILDVPGDRYEDEADAVARAAVAATAPDRPPGRARASAAVPESVRARVEPLLGAGLGHVRVRDDTTAEAVAHMLNANAFTHGDEIWLGSGSRSTDVGLMAHELTHTVQQGGPQGAQAPSIQRQVASQPTTAPATQPPGQTTTQPLQATGQPPTPDPLTAPLTDADWKAIDIFLSRGEVAFGPLTADPEHNADLVAGEIFCNRWPGSPDWGNGDPLLCLVLDVTMADPRVQAIRRMVTARGPLIHWPAVSTENRLSYVMNRLVNVHHYPVNGAAGIVGNLFAESGVLPSRIEGSAPGTPMRSANFAGTSTDFNPDEVMNRSGSTNPPMGPRMPGIGLAQWTSEPRRSNLFSGGSSILFNMDGQVDYLVSELQSRPGLNASLMAGGVSVSDASDNVVYDFEVPAALLDSTGTRLPRSDSAVQAVFGQRRPLAKHALAAFQAANAGRQANPAGPANPAAPTPAD